MLDFRRLVEQALKALEEDRPAEAEKGLRAALGVNPRDDQLLHLLGVALVRQQRAEEAIEPLRKALSLKKRDAEYHNTLGCALRDTDRFDEALESFARARKLAPQLESVRYNEGQTYLRMGDPARAEEAFRQLLALRPGDIELVAALSTVRWQASDHEAALAILREGIAQHPASSELHALFADQLLALGRFEEGWTHYLWRHNRLRWLHRIGAPVNAQPVAGLQPEALAGRTIRVHGEQGLGDEIFFLRFVRELRERGARVCGRLEPRLVAMVKRSSLLDEVEPAAERDPPDGNHVLLGDLPYLMAAHRLPVPASVRLVPLDGKRAEVEALFAGCERPLTGLTWRAGTGAAAGNRNLLFKEASFDAVLQLARSLPGSIVVLQREPQRAELDQLVQACGPRVLDLSTLNGDLEAMLALLDGLDDYIGVSNTNMHLRAALGRTARVLVGRDVEFRWMAQGGASPWFPGFSVHRRRLQDDWTSLIRSLVV